MSKTGIIDIGSNSVRLVVVQTQPDGSFRLTDDVKESVRLGEVKDTSHKLSRGKMEAAIETLSFFKDLCQAIEVDELICTATEAVRRAPNQAEFLELAQERLGLTIRVLSGKEEAYYDYVGVVNTLDLPDCLLMDIGGSSTELVLVKDKQAKQVISLPIGAISVTQRFQLENPITIRTKTKLNSFLYEQFEPLEWLPGAGPVIGIGGSFRNIAKIDRKRKDYPLDVLHNYRLSDTDLLHIFENVSMLAAKDRTAIKGLSKERADIIAGALAEIAIILDLTGSNEIWVSGAGLREGLFYSRMLPSGQPVDNVLSFSLENVMKNFDVDQSHARKVCWLSEQLYHQLQEALQIPQGQENILKSAAYLHDCGVDISYYDHHVHSFYKILNSRLNGLTHKELVMAASVAALHRKDDLKRIMAPYRTMLSVDEIDSVLKLGFLLRLSEGFDRRHTGNIYALKCSADKNQVTIKVLAKVNPNLEINFAQGLAPAFQKLFKKQLVLEQG